MKPKHQDIRFIYSKDPIDDFHQLRQSLLTLYAISTLYESLFVADSEHLYKTNYEKLSRKEQNFFYSCFGRVIILYCCVKLRTFLDSDEKNLSLVWLVKNYAEPCEKHKTDEEIRNCILKTLGKNNAKSMEKIIDLVNKSIAHIDRLDKNKQKIMFDDISKVIEVLREFMIKAEFEIFGHSSSRDSFDDDVKHTLHSFLSKMFKTPEKNL